MIFPKFKQTEIGKIPEDWEVGLFSKFAELRHGYQFRQYDFTNEGAKVFKINQIKEDGSIDLSSCSFVNKSRQEELKDILIKKGDILMALTGATIGKIARVSSDLGIIFQNYRVGNFIPLDEKKLNKDFFYYFLSSTFFLNQLFARMTQSAQQNIGKEEINNMTLVLPPISEQSAIASILSSLDAKIELNNKMNKTLEEIGQALFKKWFVDNPEKEKWKEGFLGDNILTEILGSGIKKFSGEKIYIATADIVNSNIVNLNTKINFNDKPSRANMELITNSIWFAKMKESKKVFLVDENKKYEMSNMIFSTGFTGLKVKPEALYYIWNIINNSSFEEIKNNLSIGTTMQGVNNDLIKKIKIIIPDIVSLKKFNELVRPLYFKIYNNTLQSQTLSSIRDVLLPKLMSGKIRVK